MRLKNFPRNGKLVVAIGIYPKQWALLGHAKLERLARTIPVLTVARDIFDDGTADESKAFFGGVD